MSGGKLRELRRRLQSIADIRQTTQAMKLVAAAKLRRAQAAIVNMRPFARALNDMMSHVAAGVQEQVQLPWAVPYEEVHHYTLVHITSNRGLCGAYNTNLNRRAQKRIEEVLQAHPELKKDNVLVIAIGKKGAQYFQKAGFQVDESFINLIEELTFPKARQLAQLLRQRYVSGETHMVDVVYARFKNAAVQYYEAEPYLPIPAPEAQEGTVDFIFEPSAQQLLTELVPWLLDQHLYRMLLDARASEHGARMTAMDKASENASELMRELRLQMNKARQESITRELAELVSGAAAQEEGF